MRRVARAPASAPRPTYPANTEQAKFSVGYLVPYSLVHGAPRIAAFTDKALADDRLKAMQPKITASVDPELGPGGDDSPAKIRITMNDGQVFEVRKDFSTGSNKLPMSQAQLEEKFYDCAALVMDKGRAGKILAILNALPAAPRSTTSGRCSARLELRGRSLPCTRAARHHSLRSARCARDTMRRRAQSFATARAAAMMSSGVA